MKYMESLPPSVKPKNNSEGAKYRRKQMMYQLPIHDHDENYCDNLTEPERASMRQFCEDRNQNALGVGDVREKTNPVSKWVSKQIFWFLQTGEIQVVMSLCIPTSPQQTPRHLTFICEFLVGQIAIPQAKNASV